MSRLKVYWPDRPEAVTAVAAKASPRDTQPQTLSFVQRVARSNSPSLLEIVNRARTVYRNQRCRCCGSVAVDPIELHDAVLNRNRLPIPGTATVVGFHCNSCGMEWPVR